MRPTLRFGISLMALATITTGGCAVDRNGSAVEISEAPVVPDVPGVVKPLVPRPLPGKVEVQVGSIPEGYVETKGQMSLFTLSRPSSQNEAPGLVRTWMREDGWTKEKGGQPSFIAIVIESSTFDNPAVSPKQIRAVAKVLQDVRGTTTVLMRVDSTGAHDVRWSEEGLDIRVLLSGAEWDDSSTTRLVNTVRLIR